MNEIDISKRIAEFDEHLACNPRTIFSAKFGDGKTYFMKKYQEKYQEDIFFVVIHPVSYSVAKNDDIFEYIKRDILCSLSKSESVNTIEWEKVVKEQFDYDNVLEGLEKLTEVVPLPYAKLLTVPFRLFKKIDDKYAVDKYLESFQYVKGGLFEQDEFTVAIRTCVKKIQEDGKKCVLIIEDLDRMDPGHLFRILNVLAAHIDECEGANKFGFDNIIVSLDYHATQCLFHHYYGNEADYKGYMAKFLTKNPFYYSITEVACQLLISFLKNDCRLSDDHLSMPLFLEKTLQQQALSVYDVIKRLSVRDIAKILDRIEEQIRNCRLSTDSGYIIRNVCPITNLLAVLVRMNMTFSHEYLTDMLSNSIQDLSILDGFALLVDDGSSWIEYEDVFYFLEKKSNAAGYASVKYKNIMGAGRPISIRNFVDKALTRTYGYVIDCKPVFSF